MKILYIIPSFKNAGPINVVKDLCKELNVLDNDLFVVAFNDGELKSKFSECGKVNIFNIKNPLHLYKLIKYIKYISPDIIHSHGLLPDFVSFLLRRKGKITTIHNFMKKDYVYDKGFFWGNLMFFFHSLFLLRIQERVSCSESAHIYNKSNSTSFIRNGVSSNIKIEPSTINENKVTFVYVGVLNKRKNVSVILDAFSTVKTFNLIVLGDGEYLSSYKKKYSSDNIEFKGFCDEPNDIIKNCDVFISSSLAEGMPLSVLESMACGLTFLLSDITPHREIYNLNENSGVIFRDKLELISILDTFNKYDISEMKYESKKNYESNFTSNLMAVNYMKKYSSMVLLVKGDL